jgi:hypothetical protein
LADFGFCAWLKSYGGMKNRCFTFIFFSIFFGGNAMRARTLGGESGDRNGVRMV